MISVEMVSRGRCFESSYICELKEEDLQVINTSLSNNHIGIVSSEPCCLQKLAQSYKTIDELINCLSSITAGRRIVGSITSGGYLYSKSGEGGIGYIQTSLLSDDYLSKYLRYVLIRKTTSPHYYLAQITKIFD
jgi:hypothetical protein